jgi:hypothetical protein
MMIDPLSEAVDRLSSLLKRLLELRQDAETTAGQIKEIDQLVDETVASIVSLIRKVRKAGSSERQTSTTTSAAVWKSFA